MVNLKKMQPVYSINPGSKIKLGGKKTYMLTPSNYFNKEEIEGEIIYVEYVYIYEYNSHKKNNSNEGFYISKSTFVQLIK